MPIPHLNRIHIVIFLPFRVYNIDNQPITDAIIYLNKEGDAIPSEFSLSQETKMELGDNLIIRDYKHDILKWLSCVNDKIIFDTEPQLKSAIMVYIGYLEEYFQTSKQQKIMNNKLDNLIKEQLQLENKTTSDKLKVIEDELTNLDKLKERLEKLQKQYQKDIFTLWFEKCAKEIDGKIPLISKNPTEFGFDFKFRESSLRCVVTMNRTGYFWGIQCNPKEISDDNIKDLRDYVLNSRFGFHNDEVSDEEWVVSDYALEDDIVERFVTLTSLIVNHKECTI